VQVLEHDDSGPGRRDRGENAEHLAEERRFAAGLRVAGIGQGGGDRGQPIAGREAGQEFAPGTVGRGGGQVVGAADEDGGAVRVRLGGHGADEGRLSDARLAPDQHQAALAVRGGGQERAEPLLFPLPSDQAGRRQGTGRGRGEGRRRGHGVSDGLAGVSPGERRSHVMDQVCRAQRC
jgi:hypothetical protein